MGLTAGPCVCAVGNASSQGTAAGAHAGTALGHAGAGECGAWGADCLFEGVSSGDGVLSVRAKGAIQPTRRGFLMTRRTAWIVCND